jgi:hypothetical protein
VSDSIRGPVDIRLRRLFNGHALIDATSLPMTEETMITRLFHRWEHKLASATTTGSCVRSSGGWSGSSCWAAARPGRHYAALSAWADTTVENSDAFYALEPQPIRTAAGRPADVPERRRHSARREQHGACPLVRGPSPRGRRRAVVVLPQWNSDADGHVGLCRLLNRFGISALRLSLPYHDARMPPELQRADYIVSANIGRTRRCAGRRCSTPGAPSWWLKAQGYESIGILGTSLGSCLAMLTPRTSRSSGAALNHISPYFADVIWEGLSTRHVREGLDGAIDLDRLRRLWMPISPVPLPRSGPGQAGAAGLRALRPQLSGDLSQQLVEEFRRRGVAPDVAVLPCGHYSTGKTPFKWMDGLTLCRFLSRSL